MFWNSSNFRDPNYGKISEDSFLRLKPRVARLPSSLILSKQTCIMQLKLLTLLEEVLLNLLLSLTSKLADLAQRYLARSHFLITSDDLK